MKSAIEQEQEHAPGNAAQANAPYNPYLAAARRAWDERYGDLITRARNWRLAALLSGAIALVAHCRRRQALHPFPRRPLRRWRLILSAAHSLLPRRRKHLAWMTDGSSDRPSSRGWRTFGR